MSLSIPLLQKQLEAVCSFLPTKTSRALPDDVDFVFLGKKAMGQVHGDFLGDTSPTDVITFAHGEILICPEVAQEQAQVYGRSTHKEILLYGIHGMLHLLGYEDQAPKDFLKMAQLQEAILEKVITPVA